MRLPSVLAFAFVFVTPVAGQQRFAGRIAAVVDSLRAAAAARGLPIDPVIEKAIAGKTFRDYERSWVLRSALERGIEVISEASRHLGREFKLQHKMYAGRTSLASAISCATTISGSTVRLSGTP